MKAGRVKGWCPSAYRPMLSGDGLLVRVRPRLGRLGVDQALVLADLALRFGNGVIDLTTRANLQIRGVSEADHPRLLAALQDDGLVHAEPKIEARRAILAAPLWTPGDLTERLGLALEARLAEFPEMPDKMGFAVDTGATPILRAASADFRLERSDAGEVLVVADSATGGRAVPEGAAIDALIELANWFVATQGREAGRMARHLEPLPDDWTAAPLAAPGPQLSPGSQPLGMVLGVPFGSISAGDFADLIAAASPSHIRVLPGRCLLLEGAGVVEHGAFIARPDHPLCHVSACPGAPFCGEASVATRDIARRLMERVPGGLHVSGCPKGCASPRPTDITIVGRDGFFDVIKAGRASDPPHHMGLSEAELMELFP